MADRLKPIEPKSERWEPAADPNDIVVPGLDTTASANDQIEQIEQLITIKLQNIDANFSRIQQVMANRILPAVKRYAVGTESVRDAAKFWTTFYEQAAQIRVPTYDDYSLPQDTESEVEKEDFQNMSTAESAEQQTFDQSKGFDPNRTSSEVSFAPGQAAVMSTPARQNSRYGEDEATPSWSASIESPMVRLDRELQSLTEQDAGVLASSSMAQQSRYEDDPQDATERQIDASSFADQTIQPLSDKGKAKAPAEPLLKGVLRRKLDASMTQNATATSPLRVKQRTPNLKALNPYLPPDTNPSNWKGVVDLTDPRVLTPGRAGASAAKRRAGSQQSSAKRPSTPQFDDDDSFDVGLGMSPPITMAFAQPSSSKAPKLGRTPKKQAVERITRNLVNKEGSTASSATRPKPGVFSRPGGAGSIESSISSVASPPSFTKYTPRAAVDTSSSLADASLESMMRRVGLDMPMYGTSHGQPASTTDTPDSLPVVPTSTFLHSNTSQTTHSQVDDTPQMPQIDFSRVRVEDDLFGEANASMDSDDSFDDANDTAQPSTAFMMAMASQHSNFDDDDSFDTNPDDSVDFGDDGGIGNPHPFSNMVMREEDSFDDDSFDDPVFDQHTEEETLFGVPPAQRLQAHAAFQTRMSLGTNLRMAGQDLLEDTLGIGAQRAQAGHVQETPTPWNGGRGY